MEDAVRLMPKIDLHCHLDGSLTLESVRKITGRNVAPEELQADDRCRDLAEYLKKFDIPINQQLYYHLSLSVFYSERSPQSLLSS